jgi:hypothetical protein
MNLPFLSGGVPTLTPPRRGTGERARATISLLGGVRVSRAKAIPSLYSVSSRALNILKDMASEEWATLSDDELLEKNISKLGLKLEGTELEPLIQQLYDELAQRTLAFHPPCFVGDEWFCPIGIPAIFIPFFLTHERLKKLERNIILEVEGETKPWFMKLMRHEAAHAYSYAYQLYKKKKWQQHFGLASTEETDTYRPRPYSRSYVIHLEDWTQESSRRISPKRSRSG